MTDDDFEDSLLDDQDLVDALDATPYKSSMKATTSADDHGSTNYSGSSIPFSSLGQPDFGRPSNEPHPSIARCDSLFQPSLLHESGDDEMVMMTRAELEAIKQEAFLAGQALAYKTPTTHFPFLSLPAELRLVFYSHYFTDRNSRTILPGVCIPALPKRLQSPNQHCCPADNTWCGTNRPWISTNLLMTCKQIYHEARDDYLYKGRRFYAPVGAFNAAFKRIRPSLRFWQYIQNLDLTITPEASHGPRYETGNLIVTLTALLLGGKNLRSLKLRYLVSDRQEAINRFREMRLREGAEVSLTQVWSDWSEPTEVGLEKRKQKVERLLFGMLGCASYNAPPYDVVISTEHAILANDNPVNWDVEAWKTCVTISTESD